MKRLLCICLFASVFAGSAATQVYRSEFVLGVAFRNALETPLMGISASFTAEQWAFRKGAKTIPFEWLVTNELVSVTAEGDWRAAGAAAFTTIDADAAGADAARARPCRRAFACGPEPCANSNCDRGASAGRPRRHAPLRDVPRLDRPLGLRVEPVRRHPAFFCSSPRTRRTAPRRGISSSSRRTANERAA